MKRVLLLLSCMAAAGGASAEELNALDCRAQVVVQCDATCDATQQPADLSFDFVNKTGSYCRGERCDEGVLWSTTVAGQWDDAPYMAFRLSGAASYTVVGTIAANSLIFGGSADDIGVLAGTCARPE